MKHLITVFTPIVRKLRFHDDHPMEITAVTTTAQATKDKRWITNEQ
jgi:hypothetical protein